VLSTSDAEQWRQVLPADRSVMGSVEYARFCEKQTGCVARLFVVEAPQPVLAYPFLMRPVQQLPFAADVPAWDTYTPEYTGPLLIGAGQSHVPFTNLFARYCREQRIVAEFAHLNPWDSGAECLDAAGIELNREIVYVDVTRSEEELWTKSLTSACRRFVKRARATGLRIRRAETAEDIQRFQRVHEATMDRRQALDRYYHSSEYFLDLQATLPYNVFYVLAECEGQVVAGGLFLEDRDTVYWELSAVDLAYSSARPVNGYLYDAILDASRRGRKRLVLGGAYRPDDGVFRFKTSFSPLRAKFSTYKRIHDAHAYAALSDAWSAHHGGKKPRDDYFPAYRSTVPVEEERE
jgi:hypothetical protein